MTEPCDSLSCFHSSQFRKGLRTHFHGLQPNYPFYGSEDIGFLQNIQRFLGMRLRAWLRVWRSDCRTATVGVQRRPPWQRSPTCRITMSPMGRRRSFWRWSMFFHICRCIFVCIFWLHNCWMYTHMHDTWKNTSLTLMEPGPYVPSQVNGYIVQNGLT